VYSEFEEERLRELEREREKEELWGEIDRNFSKFN
jgi:hypothetical protein